MPLFLFMPGSDEPLPFPETMEGVLAALDYVSAERIAEGYPAVTSIAMLIVDEEDTD